MGSQLQTPADIMNLLHDNGYQLYGTCWCGGNWWEKFKHTQTGARVHVAPMKNYFHTKNTMIKSNGNLDKLRETITAIE